MKKVKAFTLIELLIVITIIAILATIIIVSFSNSQVKARDSKRMTDLAAVEKALDIYKLNTGIYPLEAAACEYTAYAATVPECNNLNNSLVSAGLISELPTDPKPSVRNSNYTYRAVSTTLYTTRAILESNPVSATNTYPGTAVGAGCNSSLIASGWYQNSVYQNTGNCSIYYFQKGRSN